MEDYEALANIMKALGHPARLKILRVLQEEEACVCHLEAILGYRQAYISQQLMRLREAGLVVDRRQGMNVFYALADRTIVQVLEAAQEASSRLAKAKGRQLRFSILAERPITGCSCPNCRQKPAEPEERLQPPIYVDLA